MKKIYTSPAIEIETIEVEQGIAISSGADFFMFDAAQSTFEEANDGAVIW